MEDRREIDDRASESIEADQALRASEIRYRRLFETAKDGILILDGHSGLIIDVNPFLTELLDYPREEFIGKALWDIGPFKNIAASKAAFRELEEKEYIRYDDLPLEARSGRRVNVEFVSNVYRENGNRVIQCNIRDISARKRTELALSASQGQLSSIVNSAMDAIVTVDRDQRIVLFNPAAEKMFGYRAGEMAGQPLGRLLPERFRASHATLVNVFSHTNMTARRLGGLNSLSALRANGHEFPIEASISGTCFAGEQYLTAIIRDVTEREWATEELGKSEERFRQAFRCSPLAGSISTMAEGRYLDVNEAFLEMLKYERDDVLGRTAFELGFWTEPSHRVDMIQRLEQKGRVVAFETQLRTCQGEVRLVDVSADVIIIEGMRCMLAITRDITDIRRLEAQFLQAQKMEAVGRLAGGVAHDFNNILSVILGYTDLALDLAPSEHPANKHLEQIKTGANRAVLLTQQLLAFCRQEVVFPRILDLNKLVDNVIDMLGHVVGEDVKVSLRSTTPITCIKADRSQIEQILMNLAVNARDAMPRGGKIIIETGRAELDEIYVSQHPGSHAGPNVLLAVSDTGCGMSKDIQSKIFEPFFTTKSAGKGTGLGLSTVYDIVKQNGGGISVYSEPGKGATFKIYFPSVAECAEYPFLPQEEARPLEGSETVLVVEDDEPLRELAATVLTNAGYRVIQARDAEAALRMLQDPEPEIHLLLTDVIMPGKNGAELLALAEVFRPNLRSLFMSGYAAHLVAQHDRLTMDTAFLEKPFTRRSLLTKVYSALHGEVAKTQSPESPGHNLPGHDQNSNRA